MRAPLLVALFAASAIAVACSGEVAPTAVFTGALMETLNVNVASSGSPGRVVATDGGSIVIDPALVLAITLPSSGSYPPEDFTYFAFVTPPGTTLQPGTFTHANAVAANSFLSATGSETIWSEDFSSSASGPQETGTFGLTITSTGPGKNPDGGPIGPNDLTQWAAPHGYYSATLTPTSETNAGSVMVNVTF